jgi:uncharacterized protein
MANMIDIEQKKTFLRRWLQQNNSFVLAFSGGVDSSLLAAVAQKEGCCFYAVTIDSPLLSQADRQNACAVADELGLLWLLQAEDLLKIEAVAQNWPQRCYFCKKHFYRVLSLLATEKGLPLVVDGSNADDLKNHRPGNQAAAEANIAHPLAQAGLDKADIRQWARQINLSVADRPASPCLASRFPYHTQLEPHLLRYIDMGEQALRRLGFSDCRLRLHGNICRLEVDPRQMEKVVAMRQQLLHTLKQLGFDYITFDLEGLRSGSMDLSPSTKGASFVKDNLF